MQLWRPGFSVQLSVSGERSLLSNQSIVLYWIWVKRTSEKYAKLCANADEKFFATACLSRALSGLCVPSFKWNQCTIDIQQVIAFHSIKANPGCVRLCVCESITIAHQLRCKHSFPINLHFFPSVHWSYCCCCFDFEINEMYVIVIFITLNCFVCLLWFAAGTTDKNWIHLFKSND